MTDVREEITQQSASLLARRIADGEVSAIEVVDAHIERIQHVNSEINAVVVPLIERARAAAREASASMLRHAGGARI